MNNKLPLVSVILLSYNQGDLLINAVNSVLNEGYPKLEIIIADDGSSKENLAIILKIIDQHPEVKLIHSEKNQGISLNMHNAVNNASGKYIYAMGGDDELYPGNIAQIIDIFEKDENIAIIYGNADIYNIPNQKVTGTLADKVKPLSGDIKTALSDALYYSTGVVYRAKYTPKEHSFPGILHVSDIAFFKEVMILAGDKAKIIYFDKIIYKYQKHNKNITLTMKSYHKEHVESIKLLQSKYPKYMQMLAPSISDFCFVAFIKSFLTINYSDCFYYLYEGLKSCNYNIFKFTRPLKFFIHFIFAKFSKL